MDFYSHNYSNRIIDNENIPHLVMETCSSQLMKINQPQLFVFNEIKLSS